MAEPQVNQILEALKFAGQLQLSRRQQAAQEQNTQSEIQARKDEADYRKDQLQQQKAQFDANLQIQQKSADLAHLAAQQQITSNIMQGIPVPGDVTQGVQPATAGAFPGVGPAPDISANPQYLQHTISDENGNPLLSLTLPTPEVFARQQAERARILGAPAEEAKTREQAALQEAETARQVQVEQVRGAEETKRDVARTITAANERVRTQQMIIDAENKRREMDNATKLREGMINATGGMSELYPNMFKGGGPNAANGSIVKLNPDGTTTVGSANYPGNINQGLNGLYNGTESLERLEKTNPKLKQMLATTAGMQDPPIGSLSDSDIKELHDIQLSATEALPALQKLHQIKLDSPLFGVNVPFFNSQFNTQMKELDRATGRIAKSQTGVNRQSDADLNRQFHAIAPSQDITQLGSTEYNKLNDYIDSLKNHAQSIVQGLPPDQQKVILHNYGILDIDKYKLGTEAPKAQPYVSPKPIVNIPNMLRKTPPLGPTAPTPPLKPQTFKINKAEDLTGKIPDAPIGKVNVLRGDKVIVLPMGQTTDSDEIIPNKKP